MYTIGELLTYAYNILKENNIESYRLDSQVILSYVLKKDKLSIILGRNEKVEDKFKDKYIELIKLRAEKMPVKYITGECEFMGLNFRVKEGILIPRPDTEILVEKVIEEINAKEYNKICDVCCGSGAIGISISKFTSLAVTCLDIEDAAIEITKENMNSLCVNDKVSVYKSDLLEYVINKNEIYDVIVSNPPYIKTSYINSLMEEVKNYEPYKALWGGNDGLDFYKKITKESKKILKKGGLLAYEIGYDERKAVEYIMKENGFSDIKSFKDLAGLDRVVMGYF